MSAKPAYISAQSLDALVREVFVRCGLPRDDAALIADGLVTADLRGITSHGITRIPIYVERLRRGLICARPAVSVRRVAASVALVDGGNAMGFVVANRAMAEAIALAEQQGVGAAVARRTNHYGIASYYAMQALERGFIGLSFTNAPPTMAPWGGREALLGTNPLAFAVPAGRHPAIVVDMATSVVARGKVILAAQRGEPIPEGWALDAEGMPTTESKAALAGVLLPFAGPKGSALAIMVDVFAGVLANAAFGREVGYLYESLETEQNVGHFFAAFDVGAFLPPDEFEARMDAMIDAFKACAPAVGHERVLLPGEIERMTAHERQRTGIPLDSEIVAALAKVARKLKLAFPETSSVPLAAGDLAPDAAARER